MANWSAGDRCRVVEHGPGGQPKPGGRAYQGTVTSAAGDFVHVKAEGGTMPGTLSLTFHAESRWLAGPAEGEFRWRLLPETDPLSDERAAENGNPMFGSRGARMNTAPAVHYNPDGKPGLSACGLPGIAPERLTADLDPVTCGNCMSGLRWRNDMSQRLYKADYERFYGPGGFLDRAGQTTPASSTTAVQARAALEKQAAGEIAKAVALGSQGAGSDALARAVRDAVRAVTLGADACIRLTAADRADRDMEPPHTVTFDLTDPAAAHVLTQALGDFAAAARAEGPSSARWADLADLMLERAEAAG